MSQYTSYYLYQKYEKRGEQDWLPVYPNTFSVDGDGTMPLSAKTENDPDCGYVPVIEPIYRWVNDGFMCDSCPIAPQYRWNAVPVSDDYICYSGDKYYKTVYQVSYDNGNTWQNVVPEVSERGPVYEYNSQDCYELKYSLSYYNNTYSPISVACDDNTIITSGNTHYPSSTGYNSSFSALTSAYIGDCVTKIDDNAFSTSGLTTFKGLSSFTYSETTQLVEIGKNAFYRQTGLTSFNIPSGVTTIGDKAFSSCTSLQSIVIPDSVTSLGNTTFASCTSLSSATISSGLTSIPSNTFYGCSGLTSVSIPSTITSIGESAFRGCSSLPTISIPDSVTSIGTGACSGCTSFETVSVPSGVTEIPGRLFEECRGLTSVSISNSATTIGVDAFSNCRNLKRLNSNVDGVFILPETVTSIGGNAFYHCSGLTSIHIPSGMTGGFGGFYYCTNLASIDIPSGITQIADYAFRYCSSLQTVEIPSGVTRIGYYAFDRCSGLTSITCNATIPPALNNYNGNLPFDNTNNCPIYVPAASVDTYKSTTGWSNYSSRIQAIPTPKKFTATYSDSTTYSIDCNSSATLAYSEVSAHTTPMTAMTSAVVGDCVTELNQSFYNCKSLTSITIPDTVTSITSWSFYNCYHLTSIHIPTGITSISDNTYMYCDGLTGVTIPSGVTTIGEYAFAYCSGLTSINIPDSVTSIGNHSFDNCSGATTLEFGSGVTSIGSSAFYECSNLSGSIVIPNSVTSIDSSAFGNCSGLTSVTIGSGVTSIGTWAFEYCSGLTSITCNATTPPTLASWNVFRYTNDCPIYVPAASVNDYKAASGWSNYSGRIQAIP